MLAEEITEVANTEKASLILLAPKKDGSFRLCFHYHKLNTVTGETFPIPLREECIDFLVDAKVFTALDRSTGSWQEEMDDDAKDKTAFSTHHRLLRYKEMSSGLRNVPATFQRAMNVIFFTL